MALITDATKALEAELSIFVWARDEANDRMKRIIYLSKGKGKVKVKVKVKVYSFNKCRVGGGGGARGEGLGCMFFWVLPCWLARDFTRSLRFLR